MLRLAADWTLLPTGLARGACVTVGADGRVAAVVTGAPVPADAERLRGRVLLPGFVDAHSHAFQRALRGRTQASAEAGSFWSWRERMYALAARLGPEALRAVSRFAFAEMLLAGTTSVGEFHYLVNDPDGRPYADPAELARQVLAAARDVGIRMKLLVVAYARAGAGRPPEGAQRRYADADLGAYLARATALGADADVGLAPHSVRAVPREWLDAIAAAADGRVVHAHVAEQRAEVEACEAEHGKRPVHVFADAGLVGPRFTGVHATHLGPGEAEVLGALGATACICPTTERDLGDGLPDASALEAAGAPFAVGTDGHLQASILEEARGVELNERLRVERRNVLGAGRPAAAALAWATSNGARALGIDAGVIAAGKMADLVTLDVSDAALEGAADDADALLASIAFSADTRAVRDVFVGGVRVVSDGRHAGLEAAREDFARAMRTLWA